MLHRMVQLLGDQASEYTCVSEGALPPTSAIQRRNDPCFHPWQQHGTGFGNSCQQDHGGHWDYSSSSY